MFLERLLAIAPNGNCSSATGSTCNVSEAASPNAQSAACERTLPPESEMGATGTAGVHSIDMNAASVDQLLSPPSIVLFPCSCSPRCSAPAVPVRVQCPPARRWARRVARCRARRRYSCRRFSRRRAAPRRAVAPVRRRLRRRRRAQAMQTRGARASRRRPRSSASSSDARSTAQASASDTLAGASGAAADRERGSGAERSGRQGARLERSRHEHRVGAFVQLVVGRRHPLLERTGSRAATAVDAGAAAAAGRRGGAGAGRAPVVDGRLAAGAPRGAAQLLAPASRAPAPGRRRRRRGRTGARRRRERRHGPRSSSRRGGRRRDAVELEHLERDPERESGAASAPLGAGRECARGELERRELLLSSLQPLPPCTEPSRVARSCSSPSHSLRSQLDRRCHHIELCAIIDSPGSAPRLLLLVRESSHSRRSTASVLFPPAAVAAAAAAELFLICRLPCGSHWPQSGDCARFERESGARGSGVALADRESHGARARPALAAGARAARARDALAALSGGRSEARRCQRQSAPAQLELRQ